jgi:flagella basal body P-ring formation protein FlgA
MRRLCALAIVPVLSHAGEAVELHVNRAEPGALQSALVELAQQRLEATGLVLDRDHVWLSVSGELPRMSDIEARPTWSSVSGIPELPLTFELRPAAAARATPPALAALAVRLQRTVWIAQRRVRKGSHVACSDFAAGLRDVRDVKRGSLAGTCEIEPGMSALRDIAEGDVLHAGDIGRAPDVQIGAPVQISASSGGIHVTTTATALADARVGDQIDVRLKHPTRTVRTRVVGRGAVQVVDEAP